MRSLQSMLIKASTFGHRFLVVSEDDTIYVGKNPRDAFQIVRDMDEVTIQLLDETGKPIDWVFLTPGEDEYICACQCDGFFDNWVI